MARAHWTAAAQSDLEEMVVYIASQANRRKTARKIYAEIRQKADLFANQPLLGQTIPDLGEAYRSFVHKRWLVVYQPRDFGLEVFAVIDSSRDLTNFFQKRLGEL